MFRYVSAVYPIAALLAGFAVARLGALNRWVGGLFALILIGTNLLPLVPLGFCEWPGTKVNDGDTRPHLVGPVYSMLEAYCLELAEYHPVAAPEADAIAYIREHGRPGEVVLVTYGDLVVQFYLKAKVVGGLQGRDLPMDPDWVVRRAFAFPAPLEARKDNWVRHFVDTRLDLTKYERIELCDDVFLANYSDPNYHCFLQPEQGWGPLVVYRKKR